MMKRLLVALALLGPALLLAADGKLPAQAAKKKAKMKPNKMMTKKPAKKAPPKVYVLRPQAPAWVTADVELRDPAGQLWPNFFYGKPATPGTFTYDAKAPKASFSLLCDQRAQRNGDQSRRVLGDLLKDNASLTVKFTVSSLAAVRKETEPATGRAYALSPFTGTLELGDRQVGVNGKATFRVNKPADGGPETVYLDLRFKVKGSDLGLARIKGNLDCRAGATAYLK